MKLALLYSAAALLEIAGCFAVWHWWRKQGSPWWIPVGVFSLLAFAWLLARVPVDAAGRAYAAYGGVYIAASLVWLWLIDDQRPSGWDLLGASLSVAGAAVILAGNRYTLP